MLGVDWDAARGRGIACGAAAALVPFKLAEVRGDGSPRPGRAPTPRAVPGVQGAVETRQPTPLRYLGASAVRIRADTRLAAAGCWDGRCASCCCSPWSLSRAMNWPARHRVRLFKWPSMTPLGTLGGHAGGVSHVTYAPDGAFASCGKDGVVKLWDCYAGSVSGRCRQDEQGHLGERALESTPPG